MRRIAIFTAALIGVSALAAMAAAPDYDSIIERYQPPQTDVSNIARVNRVTQGGNVWLNTTNWGVLGSNQSEYPYNWGPQCEFPGGSDIQYLFSGGLWIGTLIEEGGFEFPRVSVGNEGWTGPGNNQWELEPGEVGGLPIEEHGILERSNIPGAVNYLGEEIYSPDAVAPQEFIAVYTDTLTEQYWVGFDIVDGPHVPLGLRVTQKSMVWDAFGFDDFVMIEFTVENIGSYDLKNLYLGLYIDGDVGWEGEGIWHEDDITGFLRDYAGETWNIPYIADNDGRPDGVPAGSDFTCPGVSGAYVLLSPADTVYANYNWWISNGNPNFDFGPNWEDDGAPGGWTDTFGTPNGDERKYFLMKNREIDYDQFYVADQNYIQTHPQIFTDPFTGAVETHDWRWEDLSWGANLANGFDTRYLISWGPLGENVSPSGQIPETYLYPGNSFKLTLAYTCGDGFHDPENPQGDVSGNNPVDPGKYVYDDLVYNSAKARFLFENDYQILPPYTPQNLHVTATSDTATWLAWDEYSTMPGVLMDLYRRLEEGQYDTIPINSQPIAGTSYTDEDFILGELYYYKAQAVRYDTVYSYFCPEIVIRAGGPLTPTGLSADSSDNGIIYLSWDPNTEPDLDHYVIYRADTAGILQPLDSVLAGVEFFSDNTVNNGIEYTYSITAVDSDAIESFFSDSVRAIAMGFYEELLVILENQNAGIFEWPGDSLTAFYQQLFADIGEEPDFIIIENTILTFFPSLQELSPYKILWLIDDDHHVNWSEYKESRVDRLEEYIANGGKVIVSGRRIFSGGFGYASGWSRVSNDLYSGDLLANCFKIDSVYATDILASTQEPEFMAAIPAIPDYPLLDEDSAKVALINDPGGWCTHLPEVDGMIPTSQGEIMYTFESAIPDSSELHGHAVGIRFYRPYMANVMLTFPLYAMQPYGSVMELAELILGEIRTGMEEEHPPKVALPTAFSLKQNYPNPFNARTILEFEVPHQSEIVLNVYNLRGRCVAELIGRTYNAGRYRVAFDGVNLASGVYFARLSAGSFQATKKLVLLK